MSERRSQIAGITPEQRANQEIIMRDGFAMIHEMLMSHGMGFRLGRVSHVAVGLRRGSSADTLQFTVAKGSEGRILRDLYLNIGKEHLTIQMAKDKRTRRRSIMISQKGERVSFQNPEDAFAAASSALDSIF